MAYLLDSCLLLCESIDECVCLSFIDCESASFLYFGLFLYSFA